MSLSFTGYNVSFSLYKTKTLATDSQITKDPHEIEEE